MASDNKTLPITIFFSRLFRGIPRLILTNLLFSVPLGAFFGIFYLINKLTGLNSNLLLLALIIPVFPFYAGVVKVTALMSQSDDKVRVVSTFISGVRENFLPFLLHGTVLYLAVFFSYWSISLYAQLGQKMPMFYTLLVISAIIALLFLFMFFYIPSMTVTFSVKLPSVYKNSFLMVFGEFKYNLLALFGLFLFFVICSTVLICCSGNVIAIVIATIALAALFIPSISTFIIQSATFRRMYLMVADNSSQNTEVDAKLAKKQRELEAARKREETREFNEELKKLELENGGDDEEYIYFNGRMVKRGAVRKLQQQAAESEEK